jgi:glycosyltransferase involved in cell wall biosynthesis
MRVTHVITRLIVGGAQENTISSVLGLRKLPGYQVNLISGPSHGPEGSLESLCEGVPGLLIKLPELVRPIHPWYDLLALRRLTKLFRAQSPHIVHTHSGKAGILGRLAASRSGVRTIIHTIHGPSFGAFQSRVPNALFRAAESYAARVTTHFVVVAEAMKQQYLAAGIGREDQYSKIFSGFELEPFVKAVNDPGLREKLGFAPNDIVVGKIARLFKLKGHEDLFAVAPSLVRDCPQIKFLLIGDGPSRNDFEARTRSLGLEKHIVFAGLIPPGEIASYVGIMDALVHLSLREGLARALPQALAAARPIVSYDCDGAKEVCLENETGFLLSPGDLNGLRDRLRRLANDPALRRQLGERGQRFVQERFGVELMVRELQKLYLRLHPPTPDSVR